MVFDPPWSPEMMSEDAKFALGLLNGLAMRFAGTAPATLQPELQPESSYNGTMCPFGGARHHTIKITWKRCVSEPRAAEGN